MGRGCRRIRRRRSSGFARLPRRGIWNARESLDMLSHRARGTPVDVVEAYQWLSVAAKQGDKAAKAELADLTKKLTQEQLRQGQERAAAFSRQSSSKPAFVK